MIRVENIKKTFSKRPIIESVSFTAKKGECLALCGGNGAGKSTILKMLTGIHTPDEGHISLNGVEAKRNSISYRDQFAYMPDDLTFHPLVTGREALDFSAELQKIARGRVEEVLELTGLVEHAGKRIKTYSKGMQQRLSFAQSLLSEAPVLFLDEPTNGLDPYWVHRLKEIIIEQKRVGQTILFTTHMLPIVEQLADRLVFLQDGGLLVNESVGQLLKQNPSLDEVLFSEYVK
ncbi:ABC transporter ATP-binding protein [Sporosarcina limicola]|uniref:ABC-2 type transport system ATP-binding protein n=1 Tax=Sporosarcina limicola TaxID=34101 RepID=A0A927ML43_9BACL|nr:ABC transporter ATP-binding protein [Sporosarcina limicola]MBE1555906.1 ABC-2 type transport system ATP-binding protein [Sporosarcina limicola]